jgi:hypothetical protein
MAIAAESHTQIPEIEEIAKEVAFSSFSLFSFEPCGV